MMDKLQLKSVNPFQLIEFSANDPNGQRSVDCVPDKWIHFDQEKQAFFAKFMPPPYNQKTYKVLQALVKNQVDAPDHWPSYNVQLVGHGKTYKQANENLIKLNKKQYAYTSESDVNSKQKAEAVSNFIKEKRVLPSIKSILSVPTLNVKITSNEKKMVSVPALNVKISSNEKKTNTATRDLRVIKENVSLTFENNEAQSDSRIGNGVFDQVPLAEKTTGIDFSFSELNDINGINYLGDLTSRINNGTNSSEKSSHEERSNLGAFNFIAESDDESDNCFSNEEDSSDDFEKEPIAKKRKAKPIAPKSIEKRSNSENCCKKTNGTQDSLDDLEKESIDKKVMILAKEVRGLRADIKELIANQEIIIGGIESLFKTTFKDQKPFVEVYNLNLPFQTLEDVKNFDKKLRDDEECCKHFKASLIFCFDKKKCPQKTATIIFKKYFSRNVAMQFTAVKRVKDKELFKDLYMCSNITNVLMQNFELSEETVLSVYGAVFNNVKDWAAGRKNRRKNN